MGSQSSLNRYSKALHGANKTVIRTRPKNYGDKAHLADGDVLHSSPGSSEAGDIRSSQRQRGHSYFFIQVFLFNGCFLEAVTKCGVDTCRLGCMLKYNFSVDKFK